MKFAADFSSFIVEIVQYPGERRAAAAMPLPESP